MGSRADAPPSVSCKAFEHTPHCTSRRVPVRRCCAYFFCYGLCLCDIQGSPVRATTVACWLIPRSHMSRQVRLDFICAAAVYNSGGTTYGHWLMLCNLTPTPCKYALQTAALISQPSKRHARCAQRYSPETYQAHQCSLNARAWGAHHTAECSMSRHLTQSTAACHVCDATDNHLQLSPTLLFACSTPSYLHMLYPHTHAVLLFVTSPSHHHLFVTIYSSPHHHISTPDHDFCQTRTLTHSFQPSTHTGSSAPVHPPRHRNPAQVDARTQPNAVTGAACSRAHPTAQMRCSPRHGSPQ